MYVSHGDHTIYGCGSCAGGRHDVRVPRAGGANLVLLGSSKPKTLNPSDVVPYYIVIVLCVFYAEKGWRSVIMTGKHMMSRCYPRCICVRCR